jgi:murein DD-endopeptidase MepM/ murein hydrolase activator NlpD
MENSLEIRHDDGTIAVYLGLDPSMTMVSMGQKVFPSQPLGVVGITKLLTFKVFEIQDEGKLLSFNIFYSSSDNKFLSQYQINGTQVVFPIEIIKKEMTKKEITKYNRNNLF